MWAPAGPPARKLNCTLMQALHARMEPLLLFFVDGASHIDPEEAAWDLLVARKLVNGQPTVVSPDGQESAQAQLPRCCTCPEHVPRQQQPMDEGRGAGMQRCPHPWAVSV